MIKQIKLQLILILLITGFLRFYNLMHDSPYFFNPDERNMAIAITRFVLPSKITSIPSCIYSEFFSNRPATNCSLNPHFFAYSQFPLYLSFLSDQAVHFISSIYGNLRAIKTNINSNEILNTAFPAAIFWLRFWSALSSTLTVLFVYLITNKLIHNSDLIGNWKLEIGNYAAFIAAFTPGLIQAAHFGTTESLLTMLFLASIYFSINLYEENTRNLKFNFRKSVKIIIWLGLSIGVALGSKLTGIFFLFPPLLALMGSCNQLKLNLKNKKARFQSLLLLRRLFIQGLLILVVTIIITILASPYNLVAWRDFQSAVFGYEKDVATGLYPAFYTTQFVDTTPVIFQAQRIFPYVLGWPVFIIGTFGFLLSIFQLTITFLCFVVSIISKLITQSSKSRSKLKTLYSKLSFALYALRFSLCRKSTINKNDLLSQQLLILITSFLIYFIPNAFLYAKWTRFMTPILPFFAIFAAYSIQQIYQIISNSYHIQNSEFRIQNKNRRVLNSKLQFLILNSTFLILSILPGIAFMSIYTHPDSRLQASYWIYDNIPDNSYVLSETANVVDIPLGIPDDNKFRKNYTVISFDFYHLDENPLIFEKLLSDLERADFIFIPSRRLFANYTRLANKYPRLNRYYQLLFSGALGFEKVAEISSFPKLEIGNWKLEIIDEPGEETYTVFDHPVVRIYKKTRPMTIYEYEYLLKG